MLPPSSALHDTGARAPSQLESLIGWRRLQLQALHRLRLQLAAIQDGGVAPPAGCRVESCAGGMPRVLAGDMMLDTRFLEQPELLALGSMLQGHAGACRDMAGPLRRRVAERIDELNQLNRCSFEVLRIIGACRQSPPRP